VNAEYLLHERWSKANFHLPNIPGEKLRAKQWQTARQQQFLIGFLSLRRLHDDIQFGGRKE
jgi:hypothetical protein